MIFRSRQFVERLTGIIRALSTPPHDELSTPIGLHPSNLAKLTSTRSRCRVKAKRAQGMRARRRLHIDAKRENQSTKGRWNPGWARRQPNSEARAGSQGASRRVTARTTGKAKLIDEVEQRMACASARRNLPKTRTRWRAAHMTQKNDRNSTAVSRTRQGRRTQQ